MTRKEGQKGNRIFFEEKFGGKRGRFKNTFTRKRKKMPLGNIFSFSGLNARPTQNGGEGGAAGTGGGNGRLPGVLN